MGRRWTLSLAAVALLLTLVSAFASVMVASTAGTPDAQLWARLQRFFYAGGEHNVPAWYSSGLWFMLSAVAVVAAVEARKWRASWFLFAAIAAAASLDENVELHERLNKYGAVVDPALPFQLNWSWVVFGALIAVVVVALLAPLVLSLPQDARRTMVLAGLVFLAGAIIFETIGGQMVLHLDVGFDSWPYLTEVHIEEFLEMLGVSLAIGAVLSLFGGTRSQDGSLMITFRPNRTQPSFVPPKV